MTSEHRMAFSQRTGVNLMAVRSQRMGVDPRVGATYPYMSESHRNKGHSEVVSAGENNSGRSTSRNMFNKLGRGADMR